MTVTSAFCLPCGSQAEVKGEFQIKVSRLAWDLPGAPARIKLRLLLKEQAFAEVDLQSQVPFSFAIPVRCSPLSLKHHLSTLQSLLVHVEDVIRQRTMAEVTVPLAALNPNVPLEGTYPVLATGNKRCLGKLQVSLLVDFSGISSFEINEFRAATDSSLPLYPSMLQPPLTDSPAHVEGLLEAAEEQQVQRGRKSPTKPARLYGDGNIFALIHGAIQRRKWNLLEAFQGQEADPRGRLRVESLVKLTRNLLPFRPTEAHVSYLRCVLKTARRSGGYSVEEFQECIADAKEAWATVRDPDNLRVSRVILDVATSVQQRSLELTKRFREACEDTSGTLRLSQVVDLLVDMLPSLHGDAALLFVSTFFMHRADCGSERMALSDLKDFMRGLIMDQSHSKGGSTSRPSRFNVGLGNSPSEAGGKRASRATRLRASRRGSQAQPVDDGPAADSHDCPDGDEPSFGFRPSRGSCSDPPAPDTSIPGMPAAVLASMRLSDKYGCPLPQQVQDALDRATHSGCPAASHTCSGPAPQPVHGHTPGAPGPASDAYEQSRKTQQQWDVADVPRRRCDRGPAAGTRAPRQQDTDTAAGSGANLHHAQSSCAVHGMGGAAAPLIGHAHAEPIGGDADAAHSVSHRQRLLASAVNGAQASLAQQLVQDGGGARPRGESEYGAVCSLLSHAQRLRGVINGLMSDLCSPAAARFLDSPPGQALGTASAPLVATAAAPAAGSAPEFRAAGEPGVAQPEGLLSGPGATEAVELAAVRALVASVPGVRQLGSTQQSAAAPLAGADLRPPIGAVQAASREPPGQQGAGQARRGQPEGGLKGSGGWAHRGGDAHAPADPAHQTGPPRQQAARKAVGTASQPSTFRCSPARDGTGGAAEARDVSAKATWLQEDAPGSLQQGENTQSTARTAQRAAGTSFTAQDAPYTSSFGGRIQAAGVDMANGAPAASASTGAPTLENCGTDTSALEAMDLLVVALEGLRLPSEVREGGACGPWDAWLSWKVAGQQGTQPWVRLVDVSPLQAQAQWEDGAVLPAVHIHKSMELLLPMRMVAAATALGQDFLLHCELWLLNGDNPNAATRDPDSPAVCLGVASIPLSCRDPLTAPNPLVSGSFTLRNILEGTDAGVLSICVQQRRPPSVASASPSAGAPAAARQAHAPSESVAVAAPLYRGSATQTEPSTRTRHSNSGSPLRSRQTGDGRQSGGGSRTSIQHSFCVRMCSVQVVAAAVHPARAAVVGRYIKYTFPGEDQPLYTHEVAVADSVAFEGDTFAVHRLTLPAGATVTAHLVPREDERDAGTGAATLHFQLFDCFEDGSEHCVLAAGELSVEQVMHNMAIPTNNVLEVQQSALFRILLSRQATVQQYDHHGQCEPAAVLVVDINYKAAVAHPE